MLEHSYDSVRRNSQRPINIAGMANTQTQRAIIAGEMRATHGTTFDSVSHVNAERLMAPPKSRHASVTRYLTAATTLSIATPSRPRTIPTRTMVLFPLGITSPSHWANDHDDSCGEMRLRKDAFVHRVGSIVLLERTVPHSTQRRATGVRNGLPHTWHNGP